jgi:hypothetical protein
MQCGTHLEGRLVDYGKNKVAGKLMASLSEEARVVDGGNAPSALNFRQLWPKTTTAMLENLPLSNRNPDCTPEYRHVLQVHYLLGTSASRHLNRSSLRRIVVSDWVSLLTV